MSLLSGVSEFFGLDIGTNAIRVVQLSNSPTNKQLLRYGMEPINSKASASDSKVDQQNLANAIRELISKTGIRTKNVAAGLSSSRVFTTVVDIERLSPGELDKTIRYQADSIIPTPPETSKLDWAVIGDSPVDANKVEVLISSVPNEYAESRLDMLESIGLNVISFEPDNLALTRSLIPADTIAPQMVIFVDSRHTDIVIAVNGVPKLTRSIPTGAEALIRAATQNLNVDEKQAEEFVFKFGMSEQKLEGQVYHAIVTTIDLLTTDIAKSIKFYESRYPNSKLGNMILTGTASVLPEFPLYLANKFGVNVEIGNAWRNVSYSQDRQNELMAISNQFSVATGLAERNE